VKVLQEVLEYAEAFEELKRIVAKYSYLTEGYF